MVSEAALRKLIEDMKAKSSVEEQLADVGERIADGKREYAKAVADCAEMLEGLLK